LRPGAGKLDVLVIGFGNPGDEVLRRRRQRVVRELAGGEAGIADAGEPPVVGIGQRAEPKLLW
jgi:hypothetical protein